MGISVFIAIGVAAIVYVASFKDDFTKEELDNIVPVIAIVVGLIILFNVLLDIGG